MPQRQEIAELIADIKEQVLYLQELGVDGIDAELPEPNIARQAGTSEIRAEVPRPAEPSDPFPIRAKLAPQPASTRTPGSRLAALPSLTKRTPVARPPDERPLEQNSLPAESAENPSATKATMFGDISPTLVETVDTIGSIRAEIGDCTRCALSGLGRKQIVHSTGNFSADLMFIGEAPGADEDEQGFPFVGRAGQLLTKIIESIGLRREEVCIGNINRCRPPGNRKPEPDETAACRPFILREIAVVKPKVIVVLGATAAHNLLQVSTPISKLRGHFQEYFGVKVMPTFHPAYLLRDPHKKREVWEDMKLVRKYLNSYKDQTD
ncbi:MAG TPA: uracil-DNA glycosylase [Pyrinomonadaceae bacterium]|nr:uracil-DNA glycosylase [Pyrinomonadaceae bacterium]